MEPDGVDALRADVRAQMASYARRCAEAPVPGDEARFVREFRAAFLAALAAAFAAAGALTYTVSVRTHDMCAEIGSACGLPDMETTHRLARRVVDEEMARTNCSFYFGPREVSCFPDRRK